MRFASPKDLGWFWVDRQYAEPQISPPAAMSMRGACACHPSAWHAHFCLVSLLRSFAHAERGIYHFASASVPPCCALHFSLAAQS
jgi:hypothetical protein